MIKLLLYHFIHETAIDVFFDMLHTNIGFDNIPTKYEYVYDDVLEKWVNVQDVLDLIEQLSNYRYE